MELCGDGSITGRATILGETTHTDAPLPGPADALAWLERRLEAYRGGTIVLRVQQVDGSEARWTSQSSSLALMWTATILGDAWKPGFAIKAPGVSATRGPHATGTRMRTGKVVVSDDEQAPEDMGRNGEREDVA